MRGGEQRLAGTNVLEHRLKDLALIVTNAFLCRHHQAGRQAGRHTRQAHQAGTTSGRERALSSSRNCPDNKRVGTCWVDWSRLTLLLSDAACAVMPVHYLT